MVSGARSSYRGDKIGVCVKFTVKISPGWVLLPVFICLLCLLFLFCLCTNLLDNILFHFFGHFNPNRSILGQKPSDELLINEQRSSDLT